MRLPLKNIRFHFLWLWLGLGAFPGQAALEARLALSPVEPFVDQWCRLELVIETPAGLSLRNLRLSGLPGDDRLVLTPLSENPLETRPREGGVVEVRRYTARVRPRRAGELRFRPTLHATAVRRSRSGMFTQWTEQPAQLRLNEVRLTVRALPETDRPSAFDGAVGDFRLTGEMTPTQPAVDDLVRLILTLEGQGWLGGAQPVYARAPSGIQAYPPRELQRDPEGHLSVERLFVVTNAAAAYLPGATFAWFDPELRQFRQADFGPVAIQPRPRSETAAPVVALRIDAPAPTRRPAADLRLPDARRLRRLPAVLAGVATLLLAGGIGKAGFWRRHPRLRFGLRLVGLALAVALWHQLDTRAQAIHVPLVRETPARLAPAATAQVLTEWPAGADLRIHDRQGGWIRAGYQGLIGWIPAEAVVPPAALD